MGKSAVHTYTRRSEEESEVQKRVKKSTPYAVASWIKECKVVRCSRVLEFLLDNCHSKGFLFSQRAKVWPVKITTPYLLFLLGGEIQKWAEQGVIYDVSICR